MGNNHSRIALRRPLRIIDSQTRAQYKNQHESTQLRRKINNIYIKHSDEMSRISFNLYDVKMKLHQLKHENAKKQLLKKREQLNQQNNTSSMNESEFVDESDLSTLKCSSLLLFNQTSSSEWEKSIIIPEKSFDTSSDKTESFEKLPPLNGSKFETSYYSFEQSESTLLNDGLSLRQHTEQMKKKVKIAIAKSKRDSKILTRRNAHKF